MGGGGILRVRISPQVMPAPSLPQNSLPLSSLRLRRQRNEEGDDIADLGKKDASTSSTACCVAHSRFRNGSWAAMLGSGSNECRLAGIISVGSQGATVGGQVFQQQVHRFG